MSIDMQPTPNKIYQIIGQFNIYPLQLPNLSSFTTFNYQFLANHAKSKIESHDRIPRILLSFRIQNQSRLKKGTDLGSSVGGRSQEVLAVGGGDGSASVVGVGAGEAVGGGGADGVGVEAGGGEGGGLVGCEGGEGGGAGVLDESQRPLRPVLPPVRHGGSSSSIWAGESS